MHSLPRTSQLIEQGIAAGLHIGAQLYVSLHGEPVADLTFGESRPGTPMSNQTLMLWLSGSKPIGAVAIAQLWEKGKLGLDDRVTRHIPEFGQRDKADITIRHILTHTAGFRWVDTGWPTAGWDATIALICEAPQEGGWIAGKQAGYSPYSSWFILGEIVRRLDGRHYARYVGDEIFAPLGMNDSWFELPEDLYRSYGDRIGILHRTGKGKATDAGLDTPLAAGACRPAGGGRGPARELGRFYEMLLAGGSLGGSRILRPQTVEALTSGHRIGMKDATFNHVIDWGLGFLLQSTNGFTNQPADGDGSPVHSYPPYSYGPHAPPRTYGHGGSQSSSSFADPEHQLAVAMICNGMPGEAAHQARILAIHTAIYEDLGLAYSGEMPHPRY